MPMANTPLKKMMTFKFVFLFFLVAPQLVWGVDDGLELLFGRDLYENFLDYQRAKQKRQKECREGRASLNFECRNEDSYNIERNIQDEQSGQFSATEIEFQKIIREIINASWTPITLKIKEMRDSFDFHQDDNKLIFFSTDSSVQSCLEPNYYLIKRNVAEIHFSSSKNTKGKIKEVVNNIKLIDCQKNVLFSIEISRKGENPSATSLSKLLETGPMFVLQDEEDEIEVNFFDTKLKNLASLYLAKDKRSYIIERVNVLGHKIQSINYYPDQLRLLLKSHEAGRVVYRLGDSSYTFSQLSYNQEILVRPKGDFLEYLYGGTIRVSRSSYLNILDFTFRSKIASTIGQVLTNELSSGWPSSEISGGSSRNKTLLKDFEFMINRLRAGEKEVVIDRLEKYRKLIEQLLILDNRD